MVCRDIHDKVHDKVGDILHPNIDTAKHYLGPLCRNGHDWEGSGQSLRYIKGKQQCVECQSDWDRRNRAKKAAGQVRETA